MTYKWKDDGPRRLSDVKVDEVAAVVFVDDERVQS